MAAPTPPPITQAVPNRSTSEGFPRGPTTSRIESPAPRELRSFVVLPMPWTTMVMSPPSALESAIVIGIRSPCSWTRRMTNWPAWRLRAIRRASMRRNLTSGARNRASSIGNMVEAGSVARVPALEHQHVVGALVGAGVGAGGEVHAPLHLRQRVVLVLLEPLRELAAEHGQVARPVLQQR